MTLPDVTVLAQFSPPAAADFIFDSPTTGLFDVGLFSGGATTDISEYVSSVSIRRGRNNFLDDFAAGTCTLTLDDPDRTFDAENPSSPYASDLGPGRLFVIKVNEVTIYSGRVTGYSSTDEFAHAGTTRVDVQLEDLLATLARRPMTAWSSTAQLPGARIAAVLDRSEVAVPEAQRDIDSGISQMQAENISHGSSTINYLQLIARSDLGRLFASVDDILTFRDRQSTAVAPLDLVITDQPGAPMLDEDGAPMLDEDGAPVIDESAEIDSVHVEPRRIRRTNLARNTYNRVTVDREGGIAQTASLDSMQIDAQGGLRTLSRVGLLLDSDSECQSMADWLLNSTSEAAHRVVGFDVDVAGLPLATAQAICDVDLGARVRVSYTPNQIAPAVDTTVIVDSILHNIAPTSHTMSFGVSEVTTSTPFIFDDATYGLFDGPGLFIF